ncbi:MAG TPA: hypothetical protein VG738_21215 [Chitinophagaceae bacterium]|nr:hypothetical protein [Chitinophagaceae bacterium]
MKQKHFTTIIKLCLLCLGIVIISKGEAQIFIKVTVLPPYSSHITDFASHPQQIMMIVRNGNNTPADLQLRGSMTGDNGVTIAVNKQYRSASPLHLAPQETRNLTGSDINALFDYNQLIFSGITRAELIAKGNLPEGNYQICVQAFDYNTNAPLTEDECSNIFPVSSVEPPVIIKPTDGDNVVPVGNIQNFVVTWSTPASAPPSTQYTVKLVEILDNRSPENAIQTATQPAFFQQTIIGANAFVYGPAQPALTPGRRYAMVVQAKDPSNTVVFRNDGLSEAIGFTYGQENLAVPANSNDDNVVVCSCKTPMPANAQPTNKSIAVGGTIKAAGFNVTVVSLVRNNDNSITGTGKVNLPVANSSFVPVGVNFTGVQVNSNNELISGAINAQVKNNVDFLPTVPSPNPSLLPFSSSDADKLSQYIDNNQANLVSQIKNTAANTVFQLPVGMDKQVGGSPVTIEITALRITATQATMDAATIINTPDDAVVSRIALGAKNVCVNATDLCGDAKLFLADDVVLPSLGLTLKGASNPTGGTYIIFDKDGFKTLQIVGAINLPQALVVKKSDNASPVTATITATTDKGWSDWMAQVAIDPFVMAGNKDFGFTLVGSAIYDHSDVQNPAGLPVIDEKPELKQTQWHGFYLPQLTMDLPAALKNANGTPLQAGVQGLIIDGSGVSGKIGVTNLLQVGNGSLGGWYYSIDNLGITIINNSFKNGGMDGKLVLPVSDISHQNAELDYHSTLSEAQDNGGIQFQFVIAPKNNLDFALWLATAQIDQSSNITVTAGAGQDFSAVATLNGHISIDATLPVVGKVNFAQVKFQQMKLSTAGPNYLDLGNSVFSLASPQHSIGGNIDGGGGDDNGDMGSFPVTLHNISPYLNGADVGLKFTMDVKLSDIAALPDASTTLSVYGKFKMDNGRPKFYFDPNDAVHLDEIAVKGSLGALTIDGKVDFYNNDPTFGSGFKGTVKATFPAIDIGIASTIQFGSVSGYKYWYVDALLDLGDAGIVLGNTGMSLFGFGGGAYYHMHQSQTLPDPSKITGNKSNDSPNGTGMTYVPDVNTALGIKATIIFGLNARPVFNADATLGVEFASSGGISDIYFDGNGRMLDVPPKPAVVVNVHVNYDFQNSIFMASLTADMDYPPLNSPIDLRGHGSIQMYFGPGPKPLGHFFIKFGIPEPEDQRITFNYLFLNDNSFYLEAGNYQIDPMPPLPQDIITVLQKSGVNTSIFNRPVDADLDRGAGFILGASAGFKYQGQFAIFKADIGAKIGFDIALKEYGQDADISCSNGQTTVGYGGWYATGQIYAGIWGSIDISTDFFGDINVLDVGAGAALTAGLPNPTYVTGAIGGYYSVLDGAISGRLHFEFTMGEKCTVSKDVLSGLKLISDITPVDGSKDMEVTTSPAVAFNFTVGINDNTSFSIVQHTEDKGDVRRDFRFTQSCIKAGLHDNTHNTDAHVSGSLSQDRTGMTFVPDQTLARLTNYTINVSAHLEELVNGVWAPAQYSTGANKGKVYEDTRAISFTTNKGLDSIPESMVEYTYPLKWQRFFMQDEASNTAFGTGNAVIKLDQVLNPSSLNMNGADQGYTQSFYAKVVGAGGAATTIPFELNTDQTGKISFSLPANFSPNTVYAIQFIGRADPKNAAVNFANTQVLSSVIGKTTQITGTANANSFTVENKLALYMGSAHSSNSTDTIRARTINNQLALKSDEKQLYIIYFKTSQYRTFNDKKTDMPITHLEFAVTGAPSADSYTMAISDLNDQFNSHKSLRAYLAYKMMGITDTSGSNIAYQNFNVTYMRSVYIDSKEYFDDYDINGYNRSSDVTGHTYAYHIIPLVAVSNKGTTYWINWVSDQLLNTYGLRAAYNQGLTYNNPLIGSRTFTDTISQLDARDVGNIDMNVINGGETAQYLLSGISWSHWIYNSKTGILHIPISYALKATYTEGWQTSQGTGGSPARDANYYIQNFINVYGGDPAPEQQQNIGTVYDVSVAATKQFTSVAGGTVSASYQLPGAARSISSPATLSFGNLGSVLRGVQKIGAMH